MQPYVWVCVLSGLPKLYAHPLPIVPEQCEATWALLTIQYGCIWIDIMGTARLEKIM